MSVFQALDRWFDGLSTGVQFLVIFLAPSAFGGLLGGAAWVLGAVWARSRDNYTRGPQPEKPLLRDTSRLAKHLRSTAQDVRKPATLVEKPINHGRWRKILNIFKRPQRRSKS